VDDSNLIAADEHRRLRRMLRDGKVARPGGRDGRAIDGELGQLLASGRRGRSDSEESIVVNPFGLAIEDLASAKHVYRHATGSGLSTSLEAEVSSRLQRPCR